MTPSPDTGSVRHAALARKIAQCLGTAAVDAVPTASVALAVAAYCKDAPLPTDDSAETIALLTARALASVGEHEAARRVLAAEPPLEPLVGNLDPHRCSPMTFSLIGRGVLRAVRWPVLGPGFVVVVDLRKIRRDASCLLEIAYAQTMHRLVDACLDLWEATAGEGVLALRGLSVHEAVAARAGALRSELAAWARERLAQQADARGWRRRPRVIELD